MTVAPPRLYCDARLYDAVIRDDLGDVGFIRDLVLRSPGPALELACGTGRLTIPWALAGREAVGIDAAPALLSRAREKAVLAGAAVRFLEADIRRFEVGMRFGVIVLAGDALGHLHHAGEFSECLRCVGAHLAPGGAFILDAPVPEPRLLEGDPARRRPWGRFPPENGRPGGELVFRSRFETESGLLTLRMETVDDEGACRNAGEIHLRMWREVEIRQALSSAGFEVADHFGNYHGAPPGERSPRCVLVCRSAAGHSPA